VTATNSAPGRSKPRSIEAIEKVALEMFATRGFDETPMDDIAAAAGVSRRTLFRYFASKNDLVWGDYATLLREMEEWFAAEPDDRPMFDVIAQGVLRFNRADSDGAVAHRARMNLILRTPALRANAALRHGEWLAVVARYAARRMDAPIGDLGPQVVAHVTIAAANAAYVQWLRADSTDLADLADTIDRVFRMLVSFHELDVH
jgi:mycofactocin system transcriptional regulator